MPMHSPPAVPQGIATTVRPTHGVLATTYGRPDLELQVLQSAAGFYIGTLCPQDGPFTRESVEYFPTRALADAALRSDRWTQRTHL